MGCGPSDHKTSFVFSSLEDLFGLINIKSAGSFRFIVKHHSKPWLKSLTRWSVSQWHHRTLSVSLWNEDQVFKSPLTTIWSCQYAELLSVALMSYSERDNKGFQGLASCLLPGYIWSHGKHRGSPLSVSTKAEEERGKGERGTLLAFF